MSQSFKYYSTIVIVLVVNLTFLIKYLSRATAYYLPVALLITAICAAIWHYRFSLNQWLEKRRYLNPGLIVALVIVASVVFAKIPYQSLNVDRWSVITSFWDNYFSGEYVYFAKSNFGNPPGPMPFYYVLALPFYAVGELGYFSLLGIVVFVLLLRFARVPKAQRTVCILLICLSSCYLWDVVCRSNVFLNGSLVLFSLLFLFRSIETKRSHTLVVNGIIIVLLLSTRNVFVIPYIVAFLYLLRSGQLNFAQVFKIGIVATLTFVLTFLPFVYNHMADFMVMNPFVIQSSFLMPLGWSLGCIALSLLGYFVVKNPSDVYFFSGIILFVTIVLHFVYQSLVYDFHEAFFNSRADISYFILCVPFLLYYALSYPMAPRTNQ